VVAASKEGFCTPKQNEKGTWVTICNCEHGSYAHEEDE